MYHIKLFENYCFAQLSHDWLKTFIPISDHISYYVTAVTATASNFFFFYKLLIPDIAYSSKQRSNLC